MARRNDQLIALQVERGDRAWEERQKVPISELDARDALQKRGSDPSSVERLRKTAGPVDQREDVRIRVQLADRIEHLLTAAVANQPIVDERDLHFAAGCITAGKAGRDQRRRVVTDLRDQGADRPEDGAGQASWN